MFDKLFSRKGTSHPKTDIAKRFNLIGRVGQGSMSKVWRATDLQSGRTVALKILEKEKTSKYESRFQGLNKPSEGEVAVSLQHPNIVKTYEFGWTLEDEMFLVMEFVEGVGLALLVDLQNEEMKRYRLRYMIQIGEALNYCHQQNWIHRDVCPRNVMIADGKLAKMIDFGLVVPNTPNFCKPGNRTGTASYMAPELIKRLTTDHRLDVFSYAVTCFEMYTRRFPWDAALTIDAVMQHINRLPIQLTDLIPNIDTQIAAAIMKGLEADPDRRWKNISDMVAEIREAEARMVMAARKAAAQQNPPKALTAKAASDSGSASGTNQSMPQAATASAAEKKATEKRIAARKKSGGEKQRASDDDIDLNDMFGD